MEITKDFAFNALRHAALDGNVLVIHDGADVLLYAEDFSEDGEFIRDEDQMTLRSISFSPVLAWLTDGMVEGSALRISIVNGFAHFERGSWHWQDDFKTQDEVMAELYLRDFKAALERESDIS